MSISSVMRLGPRICDVGGCDHSRWADRQMQACLDPEAASITEQQQCSLAEVVPSVEGAGWTCHTAESLDDVD